RWIMIGEHPKVRRLNPPVRTSSPAEVAVPAPPRHAAQPQRTAHLRPREYPPSGRVFGVVMQDLVQQLVGPR
ncbi:hypothetical protein DF186_16025, partial [Enterococcus hirae]